ncbi:MAG: glycerophosphodiester phosphodiesterase family protein [Ardenticatenaceae bacterium]
MRSRFHLRCKEKLYTRFVVLLIVTLFCVACGEGNAPEPTEVRSTEERGKATEVGSTEERGKATEVGSTEESGEGTDVGSSEVKSIFDLQGHRGARGRRPENTLPGFEFALDLEVTTLEFDLQLTKDEVVVVSHDGVLGENCRVEGADLSRQVRELTLEELKQYRCHLNPDAKRFPEQAAEAMPLAQENYTVPTLQELFEFVEAYAASEIKSQSQREKAAAVRFNLETKRKPRQPELIGDDFDGKTPGVFEKRIVELVEQYDLTKRVTIQSFDHRSINVIPQLNTEIRTVALTSRPAKPTQIAEETSANIWSPDYKTLTAKNITAAHDAGLLVVPWTVNDPELMGNLIDLGVDGLITDYPDLLVELLKERGIEW